MSSRSDHLYELALTAVRNVLSDTSVSVSSTRVALQSLRDEIDVFIESLPDDTEDTDLSDD